ncbi:MAG: tetratricopeptide repeat protein [Sphaerochaetaceae bacterium]|nr:tetratricopeptide repeat protein [Sphaerochaetaceae bacterium]
MAKIKNTEPKNQNEVKISEKISNFFVNYRKQLAIVGSIILVVLLVLIIFVNSSNKREQSLQVQIAQKQDEIGVLFQDSEFTPEEVADMITSLEEMASSGRKSYSGTKALYLLGLTEFNAGDFENAYDYFMKCYENNKKIYLSPIALFNAGAMKENLDDQQAALDLYKQVWNEFSNDSPVSIKSLFSTARLYETYLKDMPLAKTTYQQIVDQFSTSEYAKLASNRISEL